MQTKCKLCGQLPRRSNDQNKLYWSLLHEIADKIKPKDQAYSAETWHSYFKQRFLGATDIRLPNEKTIVLQKSTVDLDKAEMTDYITKVEVWAAERGIYGSGE